MTGTRNWQEVQPGEMTARRSRAAGHLRLAALVSVSALAICTAPAAAQNVPIPSPFKNIDENGVDLTDGSFNVAILAGSVGDGEGALALVNYFGGAKGDNLQSYFKRTVTGSQATITITFGNSSETFTGAASGTTFTASQGNGATLTKLADDRYKYDMPGVSSTLFGWPQGLTYPGSGVSSLCSTGNQTSCDLVAQSTQDLSGNQTTYEWNALQSCVGSDCTQYYRSAAISNGYGYKVAFGYQSNTYSGSGAPTAAWQQRVSASFSNLEVTHSPLIATFAYPASNVTDLTDLAGRTTRVTVNANGLVTAVKRPNAAADSTVPTYNANGVSSVVRDGVTTNYARTVAGNTATTVVTTALPGQVTIVSDMAKYRPTAITDQLGRTTNFAWDSNSRLSQETRPEGNSTVYAYDARGNVTSVTQKAKAGSGLADIVTTSGFDTTCANSLTCNKPNWTKDGKGNQTDFSYDPSTGVLITVTRPAAPNGVRPKITYQYARQSGILVNYYISQCQTQATCLGVADETRLLVSYTGTNRRPTVITRESGTSALSAVTLLAYDEFGNVKSMDGPLAGTSDTTTFRYNAMRQPIGIISPDPDGTGSLPNRAQRLTYNSDGQVTLAEIGTTGGQSDAAWAAFASQQQVATTYDANARAVKSELKAGGITYSFTQTSYDSLGRVECTAQRMDPAQWAGQTVACTPQTTGPNGPDRVVKSIYDNASEVTQVQTAVGTAAQANEVTFTYTLNGRQATVKDGENNLTTYEYDGFDRVSKTRYPSPTTSGTSSTTDYEQLTYDAASNVTQARQRDGQVIGFTYDNLNRRTFMDLVAGGINDDVTYSYDLLGRLTAASGASGHHANYVYDALGRVTSESDTLNTNTYLYDLAGRRTRMTMFDGFYLAYDYMVTGEVTAIRENGAASGIGVLGTYAYDSLGRRATLTRGNGAVTTYAFDPVSRLQGLQQDLDLAGTVKDVVIGKVGAIGTAIGYNPASQIKSLARSNDAYAWTQSVAVNRPYTVNGLNQATTAGATSLGYDTKGNLTTSGSTSYVYSQRNFQYAIPGGYMFYDPLGRLDYLSQTASGTLWLGYAGDKRVIEYGSTLLRRYVYGPGEDEPLVWYEGAGTADRRWLHADERGSVIAVTNASGATLAVNSYDEYGNPAPANLGKFGYTGQAWLPELGMYYYKARLYDPKLGRFLQTDPIGYGGGMNLYNYVGNDPVNRSDPSGLIIEQNRYTMFRADPSSAFVEGGDITVTGRLFPCLACKNAPGVFDDFPGFAFGNGPGPGGDGGEGGDAESICTKPLSGAANKGQTVNSRRAQVRREVDKAVDQAVKNGGDAAAAYQVEIGRNISRLAPNVGTWIRGGTSRADGNYLYGAITEELGIPRVVATAFGDFAEFADDILDRVGLGGKPDEGIGGDSDTAKEQAREGAKCPG